MLSPARHLLLENCPKYRPFGNSRIRNVLTNFNNRLDNEDNDAMTTKVLLAILTLHFSLLISINCIALIQMEMLDSLHGIR